MKQHIEFAEYNDIFSIVFVDEDISDYLLEKKLEPDDKNVLIGLTKQGEVRIKEIEFPKTLYSKESVERTANKIKQRFEQEGCRSCIALAEANNTEKTFLIPTAKKLFGDLFASIEIDSKAT
jgi:hypothetical protein